MPTFSIRIHRVAVDSLLFSAWSVYSELSTLPIIISDTRAVHVPRYTLESTVLPSSLPLCRAKRLRALISQLEGTTCGRVDSRGRPAMDPALRQRITELEEEVTIYRECCAALPTAARIRRCSSTEGCPQTNLAALRPRCQSQGGSGLSA